MDRFMDRTKHVKLEDRWINAWGKRRRTLKGIKYMMLGIHMNDVPPFLLSQAHRLDHSPSLLSCTTLAQESPAWPAATCIPTYWTSKLQCIFTVQQNRTAHLSPQRMDAHMITYRYHACDIHMVYMYNKWCTSTCLEEAALLLILSSSPFVFCSVATSLFPSAWLASSL